MTFFILVWHDAVQGGVPVKLREKCDILRKMLIEVKEKRLHEPNSDYYETCNDCGRSPYKVPPHADGCLVPKIRDVLKVTE